MTGPLTYLDFKGSMDRMGPATAEVPQPSPVAIVADLGVFAAELYEPRAIVRAAGTENGGIMILQPVGGAGLILEEFEWNVVTGNPWGFNLFDARFTVAVPNSANVRRLDIGGEATRAIVLAGPGTAALFAMQILEAPVGQLTAFQRIFVPAGGTFVCGLDLINVPVAYEYELTIREVRTIPKGF